MRSRHHLMTTTALGLALATTCGAAVPGASSGAALGLFAAGAAETSAAAGGTVPDGFKEVGGAANGLTVAVPRAWIALDLTRDDLGQGLKRSGLSGDALEQTRRSLQSLVENKAVWASDPASVETSPHRFATNLNGFCQAGPDTPADQVINDARRQLGRLDATVSEAGETSIDSGRAVRVVYTFPTHGIQIRGTQYYVRSPGRTCVVTLSTDRDGRQRLFDQIGRTIRPA